MQRKTMGLWRRAGKSVVFCNRFRAPRSPCGPAVISVGTLQPEQGTLCALMRVLGIETSCDETGVAVYDSDRGLLADCLYSQVEIHARYGGVIPELASRDHVRKTLPLINEVLDQAGITRKDLDGIAYTAGPGLVGALLVGVAIGRAMGMGLGIPTLGVHHMEGHLLAPMLEENPPRFPFVALLVSGGHTQLVRVEGIGRYQLLGESLDDAAGEAFDKVGKMLGLPYPGDPGWLPWQSRVPPGILCFLAPWSTGRGWISVSAV